MRKTRSKSHIKKKILCNFTDDYSKHAIIPIDYLLINVTTGCNSRCKICHNWKDQKTMLDIEVCKRMLDALDPFVDKKNSSFCYGGGEPLLHTNINNLISLARDFRYKPSIITNGWLLSERTAKGLLQSGLHDIMISLDSSVEEIHDEIRGINGSYKRVISAINILDNFKKSINPDFCIGLNTTINALNIGTIPSLVRWAKNTGKIHHIRFQVITQVFGTPKIEKWYLDDRYSFLWPKNKEMIKEVYSELITLGKNDSFITMSEENLKSQRDYFLSPETQAKESVCGFYKSVFTDVNGNISLCMHDRPLANACKKINIAELKTMLPETQRKIMNCMSINCHYDMNCRFN